MNQDEIDFDSCVLDDEDEILLASLLEDPPEGTSHGSTHDPVDSANAQKPHNSNAKTDHPSTKTLNQSGVPSIQKDEINDGVSGRSQREEDNCSPTRDEDTVQFSTTGTFSSMPPTEKYVRSVFSQNLRAKSPVVDELPNQKAWGFVEQVCRLCRQLESSSSGWMGQVSPIGIDDLASASERFLHTLELFRQQGKPTHIELGYLYTTLDKVDRITTNGLMTRRRPESSHMICCDGIHAAKNPFAFHGRQGDVGLIVGCLHGFSVNGSAGYHGQVTADSVRINRGQRNELIVLKTGGQCLPMFRFTASLVKPHLKQHRGNLTLFHLHKDLQALLEKLVFQTLDINPRVCNRQIGLVDSPKLCTTDTCVDMTDSGVRSRTITPPSREKRVQSVVTRTKCMPLSVPSALATPFSCWQDQWTKNANDADKQLNQEAELLASFQGKRAPELLSTDSRFAKKLRVHEEDSSTREETNSPSSSSCTESFEHSMPGGDCNDVFHYVREGKFSILSQECAICLDILMQKTNGKMVQLNRCQHYFHENCLKSFMKQSHYCPSCQSPFR